MFVVSLFDFILREYNKRRLLLFSYQNASLIAFSVIPFDYRTCSYFHLCVPSFKFGASWKLIQTEANYPYQLWRNKNNNNQSCKVIQDMIKYDWSRSKFGGPARNVTDRSICRRRILVISALRSKYGSWIPYEKVRAWPTQVCRNWPFPARIYVLGVNE